MPTEPRRTRRQDVVGAFANLATEAAVVAGLFAVAALIAWLALLVT
jgi:hypothetical protein